MTAQHGSVLLVDDEPAIRSAFGRVLRSEGFEVHAVASAEAALRLLGSGQQFDVVVTDLHMPGMGGVQFLHALRRLDGEVPVLVVTGHPSVESAIATVEERGFRYLLKPVTSEALLEAVRSASAMRRLARLKQHALELYETEGWRVEERAALGERLDAALNGCWIAFQPIVDWQNHTVYGYEALLRSDERTLSNPEALLEAAERLGRIHDVGRRVRQLVGEQIARAPAHALIFVNLHPSDLQDPELLASDSTLALYADRIVLEITERSSVEKVSDVRTRIQRLRELGYRIALDDLGSGYAGFVSFNLLEPDVVKLDMALVREIERSARKRSLVKSMISVCEQDLGTIVVCEGIENDRERDTLIELGAGLLQGYLFARPSQGFRLPESFAYASRPSERPVSGVHRLFPGDDADTASGRGALSAASSAVAVGKPQRNQ